MSETNLHFAFNMYFTKGEEGEGLANENTCEHIKIYYLCVQPALAVIRGQSPQLREIAK